MILLFFSRCQDKKDLALIALYKILQLIAKTGKPRTTDEELILSSISVAISTVMQQPPTNYSMHLIK